MKDCYVLMSYSSEEGMYGVSAYYDRETAYSEAKDDAECIMRELKNDEYKPIFEEVLDGYEVYVPDTNINYEWRIRMTVIK